MHAIINGESRRFDVGTRIDSLVRDLGLEGRRLAVEVNGAIVPRSRHAETEIRDGDRIEIVHAIGGGSPRA